jgi:hypothetical protein
MLNENITNSLLLPKRDLTTLCEYCPTFFIRMMICFNYKHHLDIFIAFSLLNVSIAFGEQAP